MKIKNSVSFNVDHSKLTRGIYLSRIDSMGSVNTVTLDLRVRVPYKEEVVSNMELHTFEHCFATAVRNITDNMDNVAVAYFGPMGCQTGFYFLIRHLNHAENLALIKRIFHDAAAYQGEMPGNSEIECGNYKNLDLDAARHEAKRYESVIQNKTVEDLRYPE